MKIEERRSIFPPAPPRKKKLFTKTNRLKTLEKLNISGSP